MIREFKDSGWTALPGGDGSHEKYGCSCGLHTFSLPVGHRNISPGVVRKARAAIKNCMTKAKG